MVDVDGRALERVKLLGHLSYNATVCGDMWSSVWRAVDFDGRIRERILKTLTVKRHGVCRGIAHYKVHIQWRHFKSIKNLPSVEAMGIAPPPSFQERSAQDTFF